MRRIHRLIGALICALLLGGCASGLGRAQPPPTPFPTLPATNTPPNSALTPAVATPMPSASRTDPTAEATPVPSPTPPGDFSIPVDGELASAYPPLEVTFPEQVSGKLLALYVRVGQQVKAGDPIAGLDDAELQEAIQEAIQEAQLALDEANAERDEAEKEAEAAYERAVEEAEWALEMAQLELKWARMRPEELITLPAQLALDEATEEELWAADNYKNALDKPWEPQSTRDGWYRELERKEMARKLAEMQLQQARILVEQHRMNLRVLERNLEQAKAKLAGLEIATCERCEQAVIDAEAKLAETKGRLALTELYAPQDGLVVSVDARTGSTVDGRTPIVTLLDVENLHFVTLNLDERHAALVRPGQMVDIALRFYPEVSIEGQVDALLPGMDGRSEFRFVVYIRLVDAKGLALLPGMTGRAEIVIEQE